MDAVAPIDESQPLRGLVALITGAAGGGIGRHTAHRLATLGADVVVHGRDAERTRAVCKALRDTGCQALAVTGDLSVEHELARVCDEAIAWRGGVPLLVHNAAAGAAPSPIDALPPAAWRADMAIILDAAFGLCRRIVPTMREAGLGRIVFVSSSAATRGTMGRAASYAAAKAGLHGLTAQLALELGPDGITVNAVAPSQIDTPRVRAGGRRTDAGLAAYGAQLPVRRVGRPDEVAHLITLLCDPRVGYLTGRVIDIDGGAALASPLTATTARGRT